ncbi:GGDEF domain-containing protein [Faecalispora anaeroviscerum]|uniref:GGDEF domain-containing protein n=1 Tax=Faecalispora anaeroviscerum TaxID=2991836 RepID=UPI0024B91E3E|nr:GGDEF domain-containing protein [Faecalispora anaeroviscerum]
MLNFLYAEVNIVGAMVLLLILTNRNGGSFGKLSIDQKIFNGVLFCNLLIFLFDTGMWLLDGAPGPGLAALNYVSTTLYYLFNPLISFLWLLYTDFKIHESKSGLMKRAWFYAIPVAVCTIMTLLTPFTDWFFVISEENHYTRGPLFWVMAFLSSVCLLYSSGMSVKDILINGWEENRFLNFPLLAFPVLIIAITAVQIRFFGLSIIWVGTMLACTSIYLNLQNTEVSTDYLTGLYNRRRLERHLQRRIRTRHASRLLFAVILDLDDFKKINDYWGHMEGDAALVKASELLRQSCRKSEDFIARLGGDEFIIVGERSSIAEVEQLVQTLQTNADEYNRRHPLAYTLLFSIGYSVFRDSDTEDSFLAAADQEMYRCKQKHKTASEQNPS